MEFASSYYVVAGRGTLSIAGQSPIILKAGIIVILPPGTAHHLAENGDDNPELEIAINCQPLVLAMDDVGSNSGPGGIVIACSSIRATYQQVHGLFDFLPAPVVTQMGENEAICQVMDSLLCEMADPKPGSKSLIALLMQQCLVYVLRKYCEGGHCRVPWLTALEDTRLSRTLEPMLDNPGRRFKHEHLAEIAGMSKSTFAQHFKQAFGRSPMGFLKELLLQQAAQLLRITKRPIKSISDLVLSQHDNCEFS
jgi:AraC family transcriptional activator of mtrCDE